MEDAPRFSFLLFGHAPEPPERQLLDPEQGGLHLTSYMSAERPVRQIFAYKAWLKAGAEHRVPRAHESSTGVLMWTGPEWTSSLKGDRRARKTEGAGLEPPWCGVKNGDEHKKVETCPME